MVPNVPLMFMVFVYSQVNCVPAWEIHSVYNDYLTGQLTGFPPVSSPKFA